MKKILIYTVSFLIIFLMIFSAGFYTAVKVRKPETVEITKEVEVVKTVDKIVYRDVNKMSFEECKVVVNHYDTEPMAIDYTINKLNKKYTDMDVNWKLYDRQGSENIKVPVYQEGGWKFYAGIGVGTIATAGAVYGGYKLFEILRNDYR